MPTTWPGLYDQVDRLDLSNRRLRAAQAEFESWARMAAEGVLGAAHAAAVFRGRELLERTGLAMSVEAREGSGSRPHAPPPVSLCLGTSRVDLYSVRSLATSPCVHLGVQRGATSTRSPVFATLPGVLLVRSGEGGVDMLVLPIPDGAVPPERTTVEALVLRAFELLIGTYRSTLA